MVIVLIYFIRVRREGVSGTLTWESFAAMFPWRVAYDHTHYSQDGDQSIADVMVLDTTAHDVYLEFQSGHFVVKRIHVHSSIKFHKSSSRIDKQVMQVYGESLALLANQIRARCCITSSMITHISHDTNKYFFQFWRWWTRCRACEEWRDAL